MHQKLTATLGSNTGNFFELALIAFFTSASTMTCYGEPMCLVANMLQQVARLRTPVDHRFPFTEKETFLARNTLNTLSNTEGFD